MMARKNRIRMTVAIVGALMLIGVSGAQAFQVLQEDGVVYAILGLEIQGQALPFNVEFLAGTANDIYGDSPTFDFSPLEASFAVDAVNEALNSRSANSIWGNVGPQGGGPGYGFYGIGTGVKSVEAINYTLYLGGYVRGSDSGEQWVEAVKDTAFAGLIESSDANWSWAKFTPVPIPAAVWLLGGGLIGLVGLRRRFKN